MDIARLLTDTQAALYLGITKELLYSYVRNTPKKNKGENRKLVSIFSDGQNYFQKQELDEFNSYLMEPWSDFGDQRPPIPSYIKDYLKIEINGRCPLTGEGYPLEDAHIIPYSESLNHHHHNIIRISGNIHSKIDNGIVSRDILIDTKLRLIEELKRKTLGDSDSLKNVPLPHPVYVGRVADLDQLIAAMKFERLIVIEGIGGVGKTELLVQAINSVTYYHAVVWIDIESVNSFSDFIILFSNLVFSHFGIHFSGNEFGVLKTLKTTFIFDSFDNLFGKESDEIEDFINRLMLSTQGLQIIITSQRDLSLLDFPLKILKIEGLSKEESTVLLKKLLSDSIAIPKNELDWALDFCNGHPLSLKLFSSLIKFHDSAEIAVGLIKSKQKLENPNRNIHNKSTSLFVCLNAAYSLLSLEQKNFIHYLKFYPAGLKTIWAKDKLGEIAFYGITAGLKRLFFIETESDTFNLERLSIPNPVRPFLEESLLYDELIAEKNIEIEKDALAEIMIGAVIVDLHHIERNVNNDLSYGIQRIEDELPNLLLALDVAKKRAAFFEGSELKEEFNEYLRIIGGIASALGKFCHTRSYYKEGFLFAESGIQAYIKLQDYSLAATQYIYLAQLQSRMQDVKNLQQTVEELKSLSKLAGNIEIEINALWAEGLLNFDMNFFSKARENFLKASTHLDNHIESCNKAYADTGDEDILSSLRSNKGNLFLLKSNVAKTYEFEGEYAKAVPIYAEVMEKFLSIVTEDDIASIYHHYAHCLCMIGEMQTGFNFYYRSIEIFSKIGHYEYLANSISDLGQFVENNPEIARQDLLDEEIYSLALNSINNQLDQILNLRQRININPDIVPFFIVSKIFRLLKVLSFSEYPYLFTFWVQYLKETYNIDFTKINLLTAILSLGHSAGQVENWRGDIEMEPFFIRSILKCCLIINGGPDLKSKSRIFYWLEAWMKFSALDLDATAEKLFLKSQQSQ